MLISPSGLCALAPEKALLACPSTKPGSVHIENYESNQSHVIPAHNNPLSQIVLNVDGSRLATASEKGTLIRVFDTASGKQIKEFRRGADRAEIYSLAFNGNSTALVVSSDKGTVHIYGLPPSENAANDEVKKNKQSSLSFMRDILPSYFSSEWSYAHFQIASPCICCFLPNKSAVAAVCVDGSFYCYSIGKSGECKQELFANYLE